MPEKTILIVDPFKNLLNAYRMILEVEKYQVKTALNIEDAYQLFMQRQYHIIITEYIPPYETADDMLQWVKKKSPETYVMVITNNAIDEKTYEKLFNFGVDDFILKPYSPEKILVHIKKGFRQREVLLKLQKLERLNFVEHFIEEIQEPVFNNIFFRKSLRQILKTARRHQKSFSLLLLKLPDKIELGNRFDHFYMELVRMVRKHTREEDTIGRDDGKIGIILPETDPIGSQVLIQRLTNLINNHLPFKSDEKFKTCAQNLAFQSYTYPDRFDIPENLKVVLNEIDKEYHLA